MAKRRPRGRFSCDGDPKMTTAISSLSDPDVSLSMKCARKGRREGDNGQDVLRLPSVPFPWSLAVHNQSLAFRARLYDAKNEAPEEVAWFSDVRVRSRSLSLPSGRKVKRTAEEAGRRGRQKSVCTCSTLCHLFVVTAQLWRENVLF